MRQWFAEEIRVVANIQTRALVDAFAKVPREQFLGPGPWQIPVIDTTGTIGAVTQGKYRSTEDADPHRIYHNVSVAIDSSRNLNNGQPSSLATWLDALELKPGDHVVHVGCGLGYYTAIIAEVVGVTGRVVGVEIDPDLAARASTNLKYLPHVKVLQSGGCEFEPRSADAIFINAGATHLRAEWFDALHPGGRLILPLTIGAEGSTHGMGFMLKVKNEHGNYSARFLSSVMIFPCIGTRDEEANQRLLEAVKRGTWGSIQSVRRDPHEATESCWLHADKLCLSLLPIAAQTVSSAS